MNTTDKLREEIRAIYNESRQMGILRTGSPIQYVEDSVMALIESNSKERELVARVDEHMTWVKVKTDEAHLFEQAGEGSGIQYFDNERLDRINQLRKQEGLK